MPTSDATQAQEYHHPGRHGVLMLARRGRNPASRRYGLNDGDFWADEENEDQVGPGVGSADRAVRGNNESTEDSDEHEDEDEDEDGGDEDDWA
eukprot:jgi/Tetstr1/459488/TSEL_004855.t1